MNILFVTETLPYPQDSGGNIVTFNLLRKLAEQHSVYFCSFVYQKDKKYIKKLGKVLQLKKICTVPHFLTFTNNFKIEKPAMLHSILNPLPYGVTKFKDERMEKKILTLIQKLQFQSIWIDHVNMSQYIPLNFKREIHLCAHNIETLLYFRHALHAHKWRWKLFFALECVKYFFYERIYFTLFSTIHTLSMKDADYSKRLFFSYSGKKNLERRIKLISYKLFLPKKKPVQQNNNKNAILFVGNMVWYPNYQGIIWFITKVFPLILKEIPSCRLIVVGEAPDHLQKEKYKNVTITGYVETVTKYYQNANVFIVPLFIGSGIRIKILEALSYKIPVVSTSTGSEGISNSLKRKIQIANSPEEFKLEILNLLKKN